MPSSITTTSFSHNLYTLLLLAVLLLAFFPGAFHYVCTLPLTYIFSGSSNSNSDNSHHHHHHHHQDQAPLPPPPCNNPTDNHAPLPSPPSSIMSWTQKHFTLPPRSRGSYLVTDHVVAAVPEIRQYRVGLLNLFVQHTSCALSLNENWDDDVRADMSDALDRIAPEAGPRGEDLYRHSAEGPDDMPAHIKSALVGASVTIPIKDGKLATGTWQGIWYLEFRQVRHTRRVVATIQGEKAE
ncbi:hypothetical protein F5X96DRAFT_377648 [Biscogniauxia mediterranea]|nr:hypothetical protein F5X96DRAFT_377648 [Biscogniauxia mediterranea]